MAGEFPRVEWRPRTSSRSSGPPETEPDGDGQENRRPRVDGPSSSRKETFTWG